MNRTHRLQPIGYEYRGHVIKLVGVAWFVYNDDGMDQSCLFSSPSIDECMAAIDGVVEDANHG